MICRHRKTPCQRRNEVDLSMANNKHTKYTSIYTVLEPDSLLLHRFAKVNRNAITYSDFDY